MSTQNDGAGQPREIGPLTQTDLVRYQGASGDFNAIHHDGLAAQAKGARVVSPGMYQAGLVAAWVSEQFPDREVQRFTTKFLAPVHVGDALRLTGRWSDEAEGIVEVSCHTGGGLLAAVSTARFAKP